MSIKSTYKCFPYNSFECESQQKFYSFDLFNCIFVLNK